MEKMTVGKYKGEFPSPASYEGNFWLNCADAHRRNLLGYSENYSEWKQASIGLISYRLGEAFWAAFSSNKNLSSAEQLQRGLTAIAQLVAKLTIYGLSLFEVPNIEGLQALIVQYLPHKMWLIQPKSGTAKVQYIQLKKL